MKADLRWSMVIKIYPTWIIRHKEEKYWRNRTKKIKKKEKNPNKYFSIQMTERLKMTMRFSSKSPGNQSKRVIVRLSYSLNVVRKEGREGNRLAPKWMFLIFFPLALSSTWNLLHENCVLQGTASSTVCFKRYGNILHIDPLLILYKSWGLHIES